MPKISISEIRSQWSVSRPTIMKALKDGALVGEKDSTNKWVFEPQEVVRWRGEPKSDVKVNVKESANNNNPLQGETIAVLKEQVSQLQGQLDTKDEQMGKLQDQLRDQTKLLEHQAEASSKGWFRKLFG